MAPSHINHWPSRRIRQGLTLTLYVLIAIWATWPLALKATTALPLGTLQVGTVPLFNLWTMWWNSDRLAHGFQNYWNAPIFHPAHDSFALSEPQPTTILAAPIIWITGSRLLAYNAYLLLSLVLNAVFCERLLKTMGVPRMLAIAGGVAMLLLPAVHWQRDVIQLIPLWGILWTWTACLKLAADPTLRRGTEAGLAFGVAFLNCGHQGLFFAVILAGTLWVLPRRWSDRKRWLSALVALAVSAVIVAPIALKLRDALNHPEFARSADLVAELSANPADYLSQTGDAPLDLYYPSAKGSWGLSPGLLKMALAFFGLAFGLSRQRWRRTTIFFGLTGLTAFMLSLGPNFQIGSWQPWWTLAQMIPGFSHVRNVFRFGFFVQMVVVILACQGLFAGWLLVRCHCRKPVWRSTFQAVLILVAIIGAIEIRPTKLAFVHGPDVVANAGWIQFIREQTPPGEGVACFPFPAGYRVADYEITTRWMYYGTFHEMPLVNGYSGFLPDQYFQLQDSVNSDPLSDRVLQQLVQSKVRFLLVNRHLVPTQTFEAGTSKEFLLERVLSDPAGVDVYRLSVPTKP